VESLLPKIRGMELPILKSRPLFEGICEFDQVAIVGGAFGEEMDVIRHDAEGVQ